MARNYKHSGRVVQIASVSGAVLSGDLIYQENQVGIALNDAASGAAVDIACKGVWNVTVPGGLSQGGLLYADLNSGESVDLTLTETSTTNTFIGVAQTTRVGTTADVNFVSNMVLDVFNDTA